MRNIRKEIKNAIINLKETRDIQTTCWVRLKDDDENTWAVVIGWQGGYEHRQSDYSIGEYWLCAKVAYQPKRSLMQEYDIDWLMPYDEASGEVDDTETSISADAFIDETIDWMEKEWKRIATERELEIQEW